MLDGMAFPTPPAFVGRSGELASLTDLLGRAEDGQTATVLIAGDAGVGKTRLVSEMSSIAEQKGFRVLIGGCMETGDVGLPYVPLVDAFRDLGRGSEESEIVASIAATVPHLGRLLPAQDDGRPTGPRRDDDLDQVELFGGVHSLLIRLADLSPVLLVMEDIHWADRSTRDLLGFMVRTLRSGRIALVATYRSDELHRRHPLRPFLAETFRLPDVERIDLRPFDRSELREYLAALTGASVDAGTLDRILARSEGNAFYAEELVAAGATSDEALLPEALVDVLRDRIEELSDSTQELLKVAAVAGRRVPHDLLLDAVGLPEEEIEGDLREAITGQVLIADPHKGTYGFRHALLQEVVYGDLLPGERTRLHGIYARLLTKAGPAAELAHHCLASHDLVSALSALVSAASEATAVSAPPEALKHLTQALEIWPQLSDAQSVAGIDRVTLLLRAAAAAGNSGEFKKAIAFAQEAVKSTDESSDPLGTALAYERLGEYLYQGDSPREQTLTAFRKAVDLVPPDPPTKQRARVTAGLARALLGWQSYDEARRWCDEALTVARAVGATEDETHALNTLAALELRHDNIDRARHLMLETRSRAVEIGARFQELRSQHSLGGLELDEGNLPAALEEFNRAVSLAESYGLTWGQYGINSAVLRLFTYYALGMWDEAESIAAGLDDRILGAANLSAVFLYVEVARGRTEAVERLARLEGRSRDDDWVAYMSSGCGADLAIWQGDLDLARSRVDRILRELNEIDESWDLSAIWPASLGVTAEAERADRARLTSDDAQLAEARRTGSVLIDRCREAIDEARSKGRQTGPEARAWAARAEAEWDRLEGQMNVEKYRSAAEAFGYGYVYEEARSRWRLAEVLLAEGEREEADEVLRAAHDTATRLGAMPLKERVEALARRGRIDLGRDTTQPDGLAGLTPREIEVLTLVASGRSNQQIADELFISRKTASVHVSHILSKLGLQTRLEAASLAHRVGLPQTKR
jgi:DNA-binding CsgD family transcriptional regulator/tetratricopeptide (TPR) repeat protein